MTEMMRSCRDVWRIWGSRQDQPNYDQRARFVRVCVVRGGSQAASREEWFGKFWVLTIGLFHQQAQQAQIVVKQEATIWYAIHIYIYIRYIYIYSYYIIDRDRTMFWVLFELTNWSHTHISQFVDMTEDNLNDHGFEHITSFVFLSN